jgi:hypothetical protein
MEKEPESLEDEMAQWLLEISEARKRDKSFIKNGQRILDIYNCQDEAKVPFNILFSNTDTLIPALYSALPRPDVRRRFNDDDQDGKAAATAATRILEFLIDTNIDGYESFSEGMKSAVLDSLLPGRGVTCVKYDAEFTEYEPESEKSSESDTVTQETGEKLRKESELICIDSRPWDSVLFGYSKKWSQMPWLAFEEHIDKEEATKLFGKEMAGKIKFTRNNDSKGSDEDKQDAKDQGTRKTATIYQIWDKDGGRKVRYVSEHYKDGYLRIDDDPLELSGFYPMPMPMRFVEKANDLQVTAPYLVYESQAKELNVLSRRIIRLESDIQAKALYDAELSGDLESLVRESDGIFVPADKGALISAEKGLSNAFWWMPIEQMTVVLRELYQARESCKQVIYEITGISDVIRGSSVASETATAQSIKSQWGTMRLKRNQMEVQRYARDLMRIMLEIAATNFNEQTWGRMTGLDYANEQDVMQAQQIMQMAQSFLSSQPPSPDGKPPQIPQQYQQIHQQAQEVLGKPQWAKVLALLKDDIDRSYRIDIETNSTIMPEASEDQKNMSEAMQAMSQVINELNPLIQMGVMPHEVAQKLMISIVRRYQFGSELEESLKKMQPPPAPPPAPPDNTMQIKQMELQSKQQSEQLSSQFEQAKVQSNVQIEQMRINSDLQIEQGKAATELHLAQMKSDSDQAIAEYKAQLDASVKLEIARMSQDTSLKTTIMSVNKAIEDDSAMELDEEGKSKPSPKIADLVNAINQGMAAIAIAHQQTTELMAATHQQGLNEIAIQMSRPKEVIRGADGKVIGVQ